ncbi:hypothetical protein Focb16_v010053 [Fusarium oxysporum f. sp. cubense]|uniref:Apple domain-containing protein n=1 Tax=Fusarium oxysporum f. sp. cubense TaxID=61366 RepID=A0A559L1W6_FUSOC|nr:hypothetical protein Focb16_v010053 [Fusarium oxysporum f. sp. cubense]
MRFSTVIATALAAFSNASPCLAGAPEPVICGGNGYVGATNTPWYKKSQAEGTIEGCFNSCTGGCKAISFDTQYKTCYFYTAEVSKMRLYQERPVAPLATSEPRIPPGTRSRKLRVT